MYPSVVANLTDPQASDRLNNPSHSALHQAENANIEAIQTFVGTTSSALGTLYYDIRSSNSDGGGHVQSANKGGTGQTAYAKGDILVAQSTSILTKLAVGTDGQVLVANSSVATGVTWGAGATPNVRVYTVSSVAQIWVKPANLTYAFVQVQGAGGGSAGTTTNAVNTAGGGGGGYTQKLIVASALPAAASLLAGEGGGGGTATGGAGSVGGLSYFGSILSATGGRGSNGSNPPGTGGLGSGGDINIQGGSGVVGGGSGVPAGVGGNSHLGGGGMAFLSGTTQGSVGGLYGGGGGGSTNDTGNDNPGAPGGNGVVIIYEY